MVLRVDRRQVLAYRAQAQGLHRLTDALGDLAVLDLGVQDTPPGSAAHALAARTGAPPPKPAETPELSTTWSLRGAPHLHRTDELVALSRALWPWSDEDALARLDTSASQVRATGMPARQALRLVAEQIAEIVTEPMPKGDVSTALTPRIPAELTVDCRRCEATHIVETLWRTSVLHAGITFQPGARTVTFVRDPDWPGVPNDTEGVEHVMAAYLRLLGPATESEVAGFLATTVAETRARWPDGLVEVDVEGQRRWLPESAAGDLASPPDPPLVRLLPPSDPWLQARDRELIAPDPELRKALWPILGRPGALLVHGDIVGTWRARKQGRRLELTVQATGKLPSATRDGLDDEAALAARVRGCTGVAVTVE